MNYLVLEWLSKVIFRWRKLLPIYKIHKPLSIRIINIKHL